MLSDIHMRTNLKHRIQLSTIINEHKKREDKEIRKWNIGMAQNEGRQDRDGLHTSYRRQSRRFCLINYSLAYIFAHARTTA